MSTSTLVAEHASMQCAPLRVGAVDDPLEREAEAVADRVMRIPTPSVGLLQRCPDGCPEEEKPVIQRQPMDDEDDVEEELVQRRPVRSADLAATPGARSSTRLPNRISVVTPRIQNRIDSLRYGEPLSRSERAFFEPRFGFDFGAVRIHQGHEAAELAKSINARAFTFGRDIVLGESQYHAALPERRRLLAHELAHTVQQNFGAPATGMPRAPDPDSVAIQRKSVIANDTRAASNELQKILQAGTLETVEACHKALLAAKRRREQIQLTDTISFDAGNDDYLLEVSSRDTDAFIPAFGALRGSLQEKPADGNSGDEAIQDGEDASPGEDSAVIDPAWTDFAEKFELKFSSILHVFELDPDKTADAGAKSETRVAVARLQYLFTLEQRQLLMQFFNTNLIPERVFNGDYVGRTTAQQRMLMAGHILAKGKYQPGSFEQTVHAKSCYHWVQIVRHYAGVTPSGLANEGTGGQFDPFGGVVLGHGKAKEEFKAEKDPTLQVPAGTSQATKHGEKAFRHRIAPWETVLTIQPGDWLYIYNANESISGGHSVVFSGWLAGEGGKPPKRYRSAAIFHQGKPEQGGEAAKVLLGEDFFLVEIDGKDGGKRGARPVTRILRSSFDAAPITTEDELSPKNRVGLKNAEFVKKKQLDLDKFAAWLRTQNATYIGILESTEGRLTVKQSELLHRANRSDSAYELACLYQRLSSLVRNSELVAEKRDTTFGDEFRKEYDEAVMAQMVEMAPIFGQIGLQTLEKYTASAEAGAKEKLLRYLDGSVEIAALRDEVKAIRRLNMSIREKVERIVPKVQEIAALKAKAKANSETIKPLKEDVRALRRQKLRADLKIAALQRKRDKLRKDIPLPYGIASGKLPGQVLQGIDGNFEKIPAKWEDLMVDKDPEVK